MVVISSELSLPVSLVVSNDCFLFSIDDLDPAPKKPFANPCGEMLSPSDSTPGPTRENSASNPPAPLSGTFSFSFFQVWAKLEVCQVPLLR